LLLNVGSGMATPVIDLAQQLKQLWQSDSDIQVTGNFRVGDIRHNWADLTALGRIFPDWQPTPLVMGLEQFVAWAQTQEIYEDLSKAATQKLKQRNL
jgi:dTDP-L-rhamnose 4-epimerase